MKNVDLVELAAAALGDVVSDVVFVGAASIGLWISDPGAPDPRPTTDVDVIVEVATRHRYEELATRFGFSNIWFPAAVAHSQPALLPSGGVTVRAAPPPYLLATKLVAFAARGRNDYLGSRDFQDIVALVDGRAELVAEIDAAEADARSYVAGAVAGLLADPFSGGGIATGGGALVVGADDPPTDA